MNSQTVFSLAEFILVTFDSIHLLYNSSLCVKALESYWYYDDTAAYNGNIFGKNNS